MPARSKSGVGESSPFYPQTVLGRSRMGEAPITLSAIYPIVYHFQLQPHPLTSSEDQHLLVYFPFLLRFRGSTTQKLVDRYVFIEELLTEVELAVGNSSRRNANVYQFFLKVLQDGNHRWIVIMTGWHKCVSTYPSYCNKIALWVYVNATQ
ncbi:hypothetical protein AVEN_55215-1 [Araneus ventricosus]|uniref:Uncharacterized protein n=1 Tax=Araneus ventricosus TaxID=182803 RepID=A0A4Y2G6Y3_ARAVE|nr:hypothetical protein AVEN_55215-1 [Araneus ventricosus]